MKQLTNPTASGGVPAWTEWIRIATLLIAAALAGTLQGKDVNWDQRNYHFYIAHAFLTGRLDVDFMAASVQSYLNPIAHIPFYLFATSALPTAISSAALGMLHGLNFVLVYFICKSILGKGPLQSNTAFLFTLFSVTQPVVVAELGTSLAELFASIPMLMGMAILMGEQANKRSVSERSKFGRIAIAFALMGMATALKLPYGAMTLAFFAYTAICGGWNRSTLLALMASAGGLIVGFLLGGGFWFWELWHKFGNPFFPFFNDLFQSADYPPIKLTNDRFLQRSLWDVMTFPIKMLRCAPFITTERIVIDPRYAIIFSAMALTIAKLTLKKFRPASPQAIAINISEQPEYAGAKRRHELTGFLVTFCVAFVLWALTSGNGRYGLPLHLMSGPALAATLRLIRCSDKQTSNWALAGVAFAIFPTLITWSEATWTRARHTAKWYDVYIPDSARVEGALYLSAGYHDRSSNSYLIPMFPRSARFANINGYTNTPATYWGGKKIATQISEQAQRPIFILTEAPSKRLTPEEQQRWVGNINLNLAGYGLALDRAENCQSILDLSDVNHTPFATVCQLSRYPAHEPRLALSETDAAFNALEAANPAILYPPGDVSYFLDTNYCRFYSSSEFYLCDLKGRVILYKTSPPETHLLGSLATVMNQPKFTAGLERQP